MASGSGTLSAAARAAADAPRAWSLRRHLLVMVLAVLLPIIQLNTWVK